MTPDAPTRPATGQRAGTVLAAVRGHAEQRPGARATSTATGGVWQRWTWRQLIDHVDRAAAQLAAQGVGPGDPVLLQCRARNESVALDLAVRSLGARVLAVDPVTPADQTRALAIAAGVRFAVTEDLIQADKIAGVPASPGCGPGRPAAWPGPMALPPRRHGTSSRARFPRATLIRPRPRRSSRTISS